VSVEPEIDPDEWWGEDVEDVEDLLGL